MTYGQRISATAAGIEAVTGLVLLVAPSLLARLLIGSGIDGPAIVVANIAGLALISLAIACWPRLERVRSRKLRGPSRLQFDGHSSARASGIVRDCERLSFVAGSFDPFASDHPAGTDARRAFSRH